MAVVEPEDSGKKTFIRGKNRSITHQNLRYLHELKLKNLFNFLKYPKRIPIVVMKMKK